MKSLTTIQQREVCDNYFCRSVFFDIFSLEIASVGLSYSSTISDTSVISWCFTSTGKERDEETGYGYFGARYMDHELMTMWLSVDPMSDKYPGISPYAYCAWNPVKIVDPDGMEIYLKGEKDCVDKALSMMNSASKHLTFSIEADGKVSCTGDAKNRREKMMLDIVNSQDVTVHVEVQNHDRISGLENTIDEGGGAYMGNTLSTDKTHANTRQIVNIDKLELYDNATNKSGNLIWHEIGESFIGGRNAIKTGIASGNGLTSPKEYQLAHKQIGRLFPGTIVRQQCTEKLSKWVMNESGDIKLIEYKEVIPNCYTYSIKR